MPFNINNRPEPQMGLEERLSQRLTFSVEPQVPPSAGVKFLQEMEIPLTLNVAENAQPPIANSPPFLADVPQRLPEFPAPKPGLMNDIAIQNLLAEPYFRGAVQSGVGPAIPAVPVAAAPTEIANQEAVNVGELLSNNVPGPLSAELARGKVQTDIQPVAGCEPTFVEECHNEYEMVCEETTTEREREVCDTVMEEVCETVLTTEYEPACFQKIINHCGNVCKRALDVNCQPECEASLASPNCHHVKVVTPTQSCTQVPREQCGTELVSVPYEKCHDVPHQVCQKVEKTSCR